MFLWQAEENITQHLETILQTLYKSIATNDNNLEIKTKVFECAKIIGHFTSPQITFSFLFKALQKQTYSLVAIVSVLNGLVQGYDTNTIFSYLDSICDNLITICSTIEVIPYFLLNLKKKFPSKIDLNRLKTTLKHFLMIFS